MAWLAGVICSRGMSHVSAMIPATVSKVDDIDQPLQQRAGTNTAAGASQGQGGLPRTRQGALPPGPSPKAEPLPLD